MQKLRVSRLEVTHITWDTDDFAGHHDHSSGRPTSDTTCNGSSPCTGGNTGSGGLEITIETPNLSTEEWFEVCAYYCTTIYGFIGYFGFEELSSNNSRYKRIGDTDEHPDNWWGASSSIDKIKDIADDYYDEFNDEAWFDPDSKWVPAINDISVGLESSPYGQGGGIFDLENGNPARI